MSMNYYYFFFVHQQGYNKERWQSETVISILCNQAKHCKTKKKKANRESRPSYATLRFQFSHDAMTRFILSVCLFDFVDCCELCPENVHPSTATCFCAKSWILNSTKERKRRPPCIHSCIEWLFRPSGGDTPPHCSQWLLTYVLYLQSFCCVVCVVLVCITHAWLSCWVVSV